MSTRTLVSPATLARPRGRAVYWTGFTGFVVLFALAFLFPVYWMVTGATKSPDEVARTPPTLVPSSGPPTTASTRRPGTPRPSPSRRVRTCAVCGWP